jgi:hypothetical protein
LDATELHTAGLNTAVAGRAAIHFPKILICFKVAPYETEASSPGRVCFASTF